MLADAACELFLEQGYEATTVADITTRAGVSRSSFFNYFGSKGDIVWGAFDERLGAAAAALAAGEGSIRTILTGIAEGFTPDSLALAIAHSETMGLTDELIRERALRQALLAQAVADRLLREGAEPLRADVAGSALAGAVLAAVWRWAHDGAGGNELSAALARALGVVEGLGVV